MVNNIINALRDVFGLREIERPLLSIHDVNRKLNKKYVQFIDIDNNGVGIECAVLKEFNNGDIIYLTINKLNDADVQILSNIIEKKLCWRSGELKGLWDKLRRETIHNDINALEYYHNLSSGITNSGKPIKLVKVFDFWGNSRGNVIHREYLRDELDKSKRLKHHRDPWDVTYFKSNLYTYCSELHDNNITSVEQLKKIQDYSISFSAIEIMENTFKSNTVFIFKGICGTRVIKLSKAEFFTKIRHMKHPARIYFEESYIQQTVNEKPKLLKLNNEPLPNTLITESEDTSLNIQQVLVNEQFYLANVENYFSK